MTLNTAIKSWQIQPATISGGHLVVSNSVSGTQVLSYDSSEDSFKWDYLATVTINEVPSGDIDGSNKEFTLANTPLEDSERVYLNGLLQEPGSGKDYTIDGNKITFATAPESGDVLLVSYLIIKSHLDDGYGYSAGGHLGGGLYLSIVDRIIFPFDSGIAFNVGYLSMPRGELGGNNSSIYGYTCGGSYAGYRSVIDRIQFPFDSGTANHVGNLSNNRRDVTANNNSIYGYVFGGYYSGGKSCIDRFQFPFDSGTANHIGNLSSVRYSATANNSSIYGYIEGGQDINYNYCSVIDRIQFPFDSGSAVHVGNISISRSQVAANNCSLYGYIATGMTTNDTTSVIDRIQFPFNFGTANHVGNASGKTAGQGANNSIYYGFIFGGGVSPYKSIIDRFTFPFDSGTAINVGSLSGTRQYVAGIDNTDFVSMFI